MKPLPGKDRPVLHQLEDKAELKLLPGEDEPDGVLRQLEDKAPSWRG